MILTFGSSPLIRKVLLAAVKAGKNFRLVVIDARPLNDGYACVNNAGYNVFIPSILIYNHTTYSLISAYIIHTYIHTYIHTFTDIYKHRCTLTQIVISEYRVVHSLYTVHVYTIIHSLIHTYIHKYTDLHTRIDYYQWYLVSCHT